MAKQITVGMHEAKTHFSKLVKQAQAGEEVVVENYGKPVAKIVAYEPEAGKRPLGLLKGKIVIKPGFDDPVPGFEEFYK
ncbi:MAG TPA: type II toxin-antitoxin system Phd/YefM family antitoxin [Gaiellaceae bacterium]|nr:type II toxin-antitoxin system Phd/YefM family antitoxin [Gaiellaceae bacterium]